MVQRPDTGKIVATILLVAVVGGGALFAGSGAGREMVVMQPGATGEPTGVAVRRQEKRHDSGGQSGTGIVSISTCASIGCHGQAGDDSADVWRTSYVVWANRDPHADAYRTLWNEESVAILKWLNVAKTGNSENDLDRESHRALIQERCIVCHSTKMHQNPDGHATVSNGVNCQSCHGPGEGWQEAHVLAGWNNRSLDEKHSLGFVEQANLGERVRSCAACHLGNADQDMNHDLIAAGHPRLFFEFASHMRRLPKHWNDRKSDGAVELWETGQVETTRAAVKLLKARVERWRDGTPHSVWPEFAEYDCLNCHHGLTGKWFNKVDGDDNAFGALSWGNWYAPHHVWSGKTGDDQSDNPIDALRTEMNKAQPDEEDVIRLCRSAESFLSPRKIDAALGTMPEMDWESVAHWYFAALAKSRAEAGSKTIDEVEFNGLMQSLRGYLELPFAPAGGESSSDSGTRMDRAALQRTISGIQTQLGLETGK